MCTVVFQYEKQNKFGELRLPQDTTREHIFAKQKLILRVAS